MVNIIFTVENLHLLQFLTTPTADRRRTYRLPPVLQEILLSDPQYAEALPRYFGMDRTVFRTSAL